MSKPINVLVGQRLQAVTFVEDYVQLSLERALINLVVSPTIIAEGFEFRSQDPGFSDAMLQLKGRFVTEAFVEDEREFVIAFDSVKLHIALTPEAHTWGPEAIVIQYEDRSFDVW